jgi:hypothetical protein
MLNETVTRKTLFPREIAAPAGSAVGITFIKDGSLSRITGLGTGTVHKLKREMVDPIGHRRRLYN